MREKRRENEGARRERDLWVFLILGGEMGDNWGSMMDGL